MGKPYQEINGQSVGDIIRRLVKALEDVMEQHNPFIVDASTCECGEYATGWSEDDCKGEPCCHIKAVRAIEHAKDLFQ